MTDQAQFVHTFTTKLVGGDECECKIAFPNTLDQSDPLWAKRVKGSADDRIKRIIAGYASTWTIRVQQFIRTKMHTPQQAQEFAESFIHGERIAVSGTPANTPMDPRQFDEPQLLAMVAAGVVFMWEFPVEDVASVELDELAAEIRQLEDIEGEPLEDGESEVA